MGEAIRAARESFREIVRYVFPWEDAPGSEYGVFMSDKAVKRIIRLGFAGMFVWVNLSTTLIGANNPNFFLPTALNATRLTLLTFFLCYLYWTKKEHIYQVVFSWAYTSDIVDYDTARPHMSGGGEDD